MRLIKRYIKQILPLRYATISRPIHEGQRRYKLNLQLNIDAGSIEEAYQIAHEVSKDYSGVIHEPVEVQPAAQFVQWRMWLGRCFNVTRVPV